MTTVDPVVQDVHDIAAAVISRSFCFVEWKRVFIGNPSFAFDEKDAVPYQAIFPNTSDKGERWIYVFRRTLDGPYDLVDEIRLTANGEMAATSADDLTKEAAARGAGQSLGKTMALPRRIHGYRIDYRFYSSRIRMPLALLQTLAGRGKSPTKEAHLRIDTFAPRVFLDPGKNSSVFEANGKMVVPVVDAITVALHLHAAYVAAASDLIDYTMPHQALTPARRTRVERRRKKNVLALILKGLLDQEEKSNGNDLVKQIGFAGRTAIDVFVRDYQTQIQWRVDQRDRMAAALTRWLGSAAVTIAAAAHKTKSSATWAQLFVPWCRTLSRLDESPQGRDFLRRMLDQSDHFAHAYLWSASPLSDDMVQTLRKSSLTVLEAFKTYAEMRIITVKWNASAADIVGKLESLTGIEKGSLKPVPIFKTVAGKQLHYEAIGFSVEHQIRGEAKFVTGLKGIVEVFNLVLALRSASDQLQSADPKQRELALIGLIGSALDAGAALGSLFKNSAHVVAVLGLISGVIDVYLGVQDQNKQLAQGNQGGADGAFLTAVGATIGTAGTLLGLLAVPGANIVAVIGLAVVAIGFIYKLVKGRSPLEIFFARCTWGKERSDGTADWSPVDFKDWYGAKGYDYQLQALLNIICGFEIGNAADYRKLTFKLGWVPTGAELWVGYLESWDKVGPKQVNGVVTFTDKGPTTTGPFTASLKNSTDLTLVVNSPALPKESPSRLVQQGTPAGPIIKLEAAPGLKQADVVARLHVKLDQIAELQIPGVSSQPNRARFHP